MGSCAGAEQKTPQRTINQADQTKDKGTINI